MAPIPHSMVLKQTTLISTATAISSFLKKTELAKFKNAHMWIFAKFADLHHLKKSLRLLDSKNKHGHTGCIHDTVSKNIDK